jgi:hypothetical protein
VLVGIAALSAAVFGINSAVTRRQLHSVNNKRAFYLAETGLSEAYVGLQTGGSGEIGSMAQPAVVDGGYVWVETERDEAGRLTLRSTGMYQSGRSTLEMVVERVRRPIGIFADEEINFEIPFLTDGYDSETSDYYEQAGLPTVTISPGDYVHDNLSVDVVRIAEMYYDYVLREGDTFWYVNSVPRNPIMRTIDARVHFDSLEETSPVLGQTTGGGGALGSNGPIRLSGAGGPVEVHGDLVPGPESDVRIEQGALVTGDTTPRDEVLVLDPVSVPAISLLPGFVHASSIPRVIPAADIGYQSIEVAPGCELILTGPGNLVVGDLRLRTDSLMTVANENGTVNVYVLDSVDFEIESKVKVASLDPKDLSLQVADTGLTVSLRADTQFHGMVYAPSSHVVIGREFEVFGMLVGNTLSIDPYARLHFDSGILGDSGAVPVPELISWRTVDIPAAVAQHRGDPLEVLNVDKADLLSIADCQKRTSWWFKVAYIDGNGDPAVYEGPYESWDPSVVSSYTGQTSLERPTADLQGQWTMFVRYRDGFGVTQQYEGSVDYYAEQLMGDVTLIYERYVYPPPELR